jgi:hypothetical protein
MKSVLLHKFLTRGYSLVIISLFYFLGIHFFSVEDSSGQIFWITVGIQVSTAVFLSFLSHHFRIIREKSHLPFVFYLLFAGTSPGSFLMWKDNLYALVILCCFFFLFKSYEEERPQKQALNIGIFLTGGALFYPFFYILIPVFIWGLYQFRSLNLKSLLAAFCGSLLVYLFLFCWCLYMKDPASFFIFLPDWETFMPQLITFNVQDLIVFLFVITLFIVSGVNIYIAGISEKIKNHVILSFSFFFSFFILILLFVESQWEAEWKCLLALPLTLLFSHFFSTGTSKIKTFLLILSVILFIGAGIWHLY